MEDIFYCFECDYKFRTNEKEFIKDILNNFTKDEITGFALYINNNMYSLQFHIGMYFETDSIREKFDLWLKEKYPNKSIKPNITPIELIQSANIVSISNADQVDIIITPYANGLFLFPEKSTLERNYPQYKPALQTEPKIFLSHSSIDKINIVEPLYNYLQSRQIAVWLDKYEIDYGDNIYKKVNEGIQKSEFAIFVLTENFLNSKWPNEELSSLTDLIFTDKSLVIVDVKDKAVIPKMISARKYMEWNNGECLPKLADVIKRKLNS